VVALAQAKQCCPSLQEIAGAIRRAPSICAALVSERQADARRPPRSLSPLLGRAEGEVFRCQPDDTGESHHGVLIVIDENIGVGTSAAAVWIGMWAEGEPSNLVFSDALHVGCHVIGVVKGGLGTKFVDRFLNLRLQLGAGQVALREKWELERVALLWFEAVAARKLTFSPPRVEFEALLMTIVSAPVPGKITLGPLPASIRSAPPKVSNQSSPAPVVTLLDLLPLNRI
jgi:hypothetical protein